MAGKRGLHLAFVCGFWALILAACSQPLPDLQQLPILDLFRSQQPQAAAPPPGQAPETLIPAAANSEPAGEVETESEIETAEAVQIYFLSPTDGAEVSSPLVVEMGATGVEVVPAGEMREGAGHMHILVDEEFVPAGEVILATETMIHFGQGQMSAELSLAPGEHVLRLQFADGAHIALEGEEYRDEIRVVVTDGGHEHAAAEEGPSVYFVSPTDGAEVSSPLVVEMGATGVEVVSRARCAGGHMHILVDEEFVPLAGEVILATETMIHFGQGQMSAELSLAPGEHVAPAVCGWGAHRAGGRGVPR